MRKKASEDDIQYTLTNRGYDVTNLSIYRKSIKEYEQLTDHGSVPKKEKLICSCLWLAQKMVKTQRGRGIDYEDLVQEANLGLVEKAVEKYDPSKGAFTTYAAHWISQKAIRFVQTHARTMRLPIDIQDDWMAIKDLWINKPELNGDDISTIKALGITPGRYKLALRHGRSLLRLDSTINLDISDSPVPYVERVPSNINTPEESLIQSEEMKLLSDLLSQLTERERKLIEMRWGCNGYETAHSLQDCADVLGGVSRERARQIENKAMKRLRELAGVKNCEGMKLSDVKPILGKKRKHVRTRGLTE